MPRIITILICIFATLILILFLVWPKYKDLRSSQLEIKRKETELGYMEEYFSDLSKTSEELTRYEVELSKIDSALPADPSIPSLLNFLQKTSAQNGLIFKDFGGFSIVSPPKPGEGKAPSKEGELPSKIKKIHIDFEVSGSYPALKNFLTTLENSARIFEVESISFSSEEEEIFSFDLAIETYSY